MLGSRMYRDFEQDPFFRDHMAGMSQMQDSINQMMGGMMGGLMGPSMMGPSMMPAITDGNSARDQMLRRGGQQDNPGAMMRQQDPFGFPSMFGQMDAMMGNMRSMMGSLQQQMREGSQDPNAHYFSSSTMMTYDNSRGGEPRVYQASRSTRQGPGGVRETRRAVRDSERGIAKMEVGRHIRDRGHVMEREENMRTGDREDRQNFINLDENDLERFNSDWRSQGRFPFSEGTGEMGPAALGAGRDRQRALPPSRGHGADESTHSKKAKKSRKNVKGAKNRDY